MSDPGMTNQQAALIAAALSVKTPTSPGGNGFTRAEWDAVQRQQTEAMLRRASAGLTWLNNEDRKQAKQHRDVT